MESPTKTIFPPEFCNEICTTLVWTIKKPQFCRKDLKKNVLPFQNGGQITGFFLKRHFDFGQNLKNKETNKHFSKGIFQ